MAGYCKTHIHSYVALNKVTVNWCVVTSMVYTKHRQRQQLSDGYSEASCVKLVNHLELHTTKAQCCQWVCLETDNSAV